MKRLLIAAAMLAATVAGLIAPAAAQASITQTRIQAGATYALSWQNMSVRPGWIYPGGTAGWPNPHNLSWSRWMPNGAKATGKLSLWNHCGRTPIATCKPSVYNATVWANNKQFHRGHPYFKHVQIDYGRKQHRMDMWFGYSSGATVPSWHLYGDWNG